MTEYISLDEAKAWIQGHVLDSDGWNQANDDQKQTALNLAMDHIDSLRLDGVKSDPKQAREFPRAICSPYIEPRGPYLKVEHLSWGPGWYSQIDVPEQVKEATCYEAVEILNHFWDSGKKERLDLQDDLVLNVSYGDASETYSPGAGCRELISIEAARIMKKFRGQIVTL